MELPRRKRTRLEGYDYSCSGYYFVTICTHNRRQILSRIVGQGLAPAENRLSCCGEIVRRQLLELGNRYPQVRIDKYVIMPNHIHAIVVIENGAAGASPCPTLSDVICAFKSIATRECRNLYPTEKLFQTSFYDHIIRGEKDYFEIWEYIENNPMKWEEDCFFSA